MTRTPSIRDAPPSGMHPSGFQGHIKGASICDLVQMECLSGVTRVIKVTSGGIVGHLYFRAGALVHALARTLTGDAAALEMLSWEEGTFEPTEREWPSRDSVSSSWQALVLRAAQIRDEGRGHSVVALREAKRDPKAPAAIGENMEFEATPLEVGGHVLRREDFDVVVRLAPSGDVVFRHGEADAFSDAVAYACRLTELIGDDLGIARFMAMEVTFKSGRCFIVRDADAHIVALRPRPSADVASLRQLFGV